MTSEHLYLAALLLINESALQHVSLVMTKLLNELWEISTAFFQPLDLQTESEPFSVHWNNMSDFVIHRDAK